LVDVETQDEWELRKFGFIQDKFYDVIAYFDDIKFPENKYVKSNKFINEKYDIINFLSKNENYLLENYISYLSELDFTIKKDTVYSYFLYSCSVSYREYDHKLLLCSYKHIKNEYDNNAIRNKIENSIEKLNSKFPSIFSEWYNLPVIYNVLNSSDIIMECNSSDLIQLNFDNLAWTEFEDFLVQYQSDINIMTKMNKTYKSKFKEAIESIKRKVSSDFYNFIDNQVENKITVIQKVNLVSNSFFSDSFLEIKYKLEEIKYNSKELKSIEGLALLEYYKNNTLYTGNKPYNYCYGMGPYCSPLKGYSECSFIDIEASKNVDVLVLIKKDNEIYDHAYIRSGGSYKFSDLGNGSFQCFFYSGNGWNPNKFIKKTICGAITGGFVADISVQKANIIRLNNSSMSYILYSVIDGNFLPKQSSITEAF
jgi:hypothetical protein